MTLDDAAWMRRALEVSRDARWIAPPNPWVGCVIVDDDGVEVACGSSAEPGQAHAEVAALAVAGPTARGATLFVTLEPCCHVGRTPPCTDAIIAAGVRRVVVAIEDPDSRVTGRGLAILRDAGVEVVLGPGDAEVRRDLAAYLVHRRTGRPMVIVKIAATLDGRVAMADGSSKWITGPAARADAHRMRADSQAIIVGAGTVRRDNPALTARVDGRTMEPLRVVLGRAAPGARVHPCWERHGELTTVLDELGAAGVLQVLVEGGPATASQFIEGALAHRVVLYLAPALAGADGGLGALSGLRTESMDGLRRGRILAVQQIGEDVRVDLEV